MKLKKKWIVGILLVVPLAVFLGLFYYFYGEDKNSFTISDRKWIEQHISTIVDFDVISDYPVFSDGVFKQFIDDFSDDTGFEFNTIQRGKEESTSSKGYRFRLLGNQDVLNDNDLLLQEDVYVLYGRNSGRIDSIKDLGAKTIGVLESDSDEIIYYLKSFNELKYKSYKTSQDLFKDYEDSKVDLIIVPNAMYMNKTMLNDSYNIKYIFTGITKKITLTLADDKNNEDMNNIVRKYFNNWKKKSYIDTYNKSILNYYLNKANVSDKDKTEFLTKTYTYGYVENYPYEVYQRGEFTGIAAEYINRMMRLANTDFISFKEYDSIKELKKDIDNGEIDIYFNYYDYENSDYKSTVSTFIEKYVVLGRLENSFVVNSFESMKNKKVSIMTNNSIFNYFKDNSKALLIPTDNLSDLIDNGDDNLIVVDKEVYEYYKNSKFKNFSVLFESTITNDYKFMIHNDDTNKVFYDIFNYIIGTNSYFNYRNVGLNSLHTSVLEKSSFEELYLIILSVILIPIIILIALYLLLKRHKKIKQIRKEDRRKYTDMLTSLKNRNYLNHQIKVWTESQKYPQSIILIDLNNVKYVNDNYGHEQGDNLIVGAASILINTQLENSEIIRSDGNEFLIYLVGYSEQQISTYSKKLTKEFKGLPYGFGAAVGYSMILDDIKTIDDAINEATIEMKKDKEEYK